MKTILILLIFVVSIFLHIFWGLNLSSFSYVDKVILFDLRLPRTILGVAVGGGLGVSGLFLQGLFKNPLVEPYTLGISGGGAIGAALAISLSINKSVGFLFSVPTFALLGALSAVFVILGSFNKRDINRILLTGVIISFVSSSFLMLILSVSRAENLHGIIYWMLGSLDESNNTLIYINFFISIIGCFIFFAISGQVNLLQLGYDKSASLGVDLDFITKSIIVTSCVITAFSVTAAGMIGFIGLIIPQFMRKIIGYDLRVLTFLTFLASSSFLIICDIIAKNIIAPNELPVGVITGILGGIVFIFIYKKEGLKR